MLHVVRFRRRDLAATIGQINATGYGLTLGVQSRIDETIAEVLAAAHVGNVYVNRNMVGAVVGVQPFGGEGLSGTGPKAGGPLYLMRLLARPPADAMVRALRDSEEIEAGAALQHLPALRALQGWAELGGDRSLAGICQRFAELSRVGIGVALAGPTGERNVYTLHPREAVLCLADADADRLVQLAAVLAVGSRAIWPAAAEALRARLPEVVRAEIDLVADWRVPDARFDVVLHHGGTAELLDVARAVAERSGADRRRRGTASGRDGAAARAARRRARGQHQHRGCGRQRDVDDAAMKRTTPARVLVAAVLGTVAVAAAAETIERTMEVGGRERSYEIDVPAGAEPGRDWPAVARLPRRRRLGGVGADADANEREGRRRRLRRGLSAGLAAAFAGKLKTWNAGTCCGWAMQHQRRRDGIRRRAARRPRRPSSRSIAGASLRPASRTAGWWPIRSRARSPTASPRSRSSPAR